MTAVAFNVALAQGVAIVPLDFYDEIEGSHEDSAWRAYRRKQPEATNLILVHNWEGVAAVVVLDSVEGPAAALRLLQQVQARNPTLAATGRLDVPPHAGHVWTDVAAVTYDLTVSVGSCTS